MILAIYLWSWSPTQSVCLSTHPIKCKVPLHFCPERYRNIWVPCRPHRSHEGWGTLPQVELSTWASPMLLDYCLGPYWRWGVYRAALETDNLFVGCMGKPSSSWTPLSYLGTSSVHATLVLRQVKTRTLCLTFSIPIWPLFSYNSWSQNWAGFEVSISSVAHPPSNIFFLEQPDSRHNHHRKEQYSLCAKQEALWSSTDVRRGDSIALKCFSLQIMSGFHEYFLVWNQEVKEVSCDQCSPLPHSL